MNSFTAIVISNILPATHTWRQVSYYGKPPAKRNAFTSVAFSGSMFVFGGYDGKNRLNDLHEFDFGTVPPIVEI